MDFGKILDQWEYDNCGKRNVYGVDKVRHDDYSVRRVSGEGRRQLRRMSPERTLDLHGFTVDDGIRELDGFLSRACRDACKKVLIIHGKGKHSPGGAVLKEAVRKYLATSPLIGETGRPGRNDGGDGATWAIIKRSSHPR